MSVGTPDYNPVVESTNDQIEMMQQFMGQMMEDMQDTNQFMMDQFNQQNNSAFDGLSGQLSEMMSSFTESLTSGISFDNPFAGDIGNTDSGRISTSQLPNMPQNSHCGCNHGPSSNPFQYDSVVGNSPTPPLGLEWA